MLTAKHLRAPLLRALLAALGPVPDIPSTQQLLLQIAAPREQEVQDETVVLPSLAFEELQLCAWLHDREQLGGARATHRRRNLESRYDDLRMRTAVYLRPAWAFGLRELPHELVDEQLDSNAALLDLYLGRDEAGEYCTYASVYFRKTWRRYGTKHAATELTSEVNPIDTTSSLLLDGLAPFIGSLRYHVQEPSVWRPVSRAGAAALAHGSNLILGKLVDDLADLSEAGCEHLVVCPHGPLAFVPFHLLPVQGSPLADDFIVTTVPSLGSMLEYPNGQPQSPAVRLGIVRRSKRRRSIRPSRGTADGQSSRRAEFHYGRHHQPRRTRSDTGRHERLTGTLSLRPPRCARRCARLISRVSLSFPRRS